MNPPPSALAPFLRACAVWTALVGLVAFLSGSASAFFLWSLDAVTRVRFEHGWLIWLLPLCALATLLVYRRFGGESGRGTDLILDHIHEPGAGVPFRLVPLVLGGSLLTHLCGGSAGREGTAVQMGGGIAGAVLAWCKVRAERHPMILMAGVAAGFGSIFGTPVAGAVFAAEVLTVGRFRASALPLCLAASFLADRVCHAWGAAHSAYRIAPVAAAPLDYARALAVGLACGLAARLFLAGGHGFGKLLAKLKPFWLKAFPGTVAVLALTLLLGTDAYLGLGTLPSAPGALTLGSCFVNEPIPALAFLWKGLLTVLTLSAGCKGGEVTPLFFVGAALGHALAVPLGLPVDLAAGLGFVAVFAGASNTPLACMVMGVELFGVSHAPLVACACVAAFLAGGPGSLYAAQRRAPGWFFRR